MTPQVDPERAGVRSAAMEQLQGLHGLALQLRSNVSAFDFALLAGVLRAHRDALAALRFELLVSPGLRALPRPEDEAAFVRQAAAVSQSTEATWVAVRRCLERGPALAAETESLVADFAMAFRAIDRRVTAQAQTAAMLRERLEARAGVPGAAGGAIETLVARNAGVVQALARMEQLCASARPAQQAAYQLVDRQAALAATLKYLATRLRGGLLDGLRSLLADEGGRSADDVHRAQTARGDLQAALAEAAADLERLQAATQDLLVWLHAIAQQSAQPGAPR